MTVVSVVDYQSSNCTLWLFAGVLFALKVINNSMDPSGIQYVMGMFPVPTKFVCWAELVLIHLMVPNASFLGENQCQLL